MLIGESTHSRGDERSRERISGRRSLPLMLATLMAHGRAACYLLDLNRGMNAMFLNSDEGCVDLSPSDLRQYLERWTSSAEGRARDRSPIKRGALLRKHARALRRRPPAGFSIAPTGGGAVTSQSQARIAHAPSAARKLGRRFVHGALGGRRRRAPG
jgi:hypothetical protein